MSSNLTDTHKNDAHALFSRTLTQSDPEVVSSLSQEYIRQRDGVELIASENMVSTAVLQAIGNVLTNKYAEGYPNRRYYGGCEHADHLEQLAIDRAKTLFGAETVNVQPHSGASANIAVFLALLKPGDTYLALSLDAGGHLSHGARPNISCKWFKPVHYGVTSDGTIDYNQVHKLAREHKPKLIITGGSAYAKLIDFSRFRDIADDVGALLMVDMAHLSGLVAGKAIPSPIPHADVVTSTTNKTLRGPRGGIILSRDENIGKKINAAIFPGLQGGPQMNIIAAKAVAFAEAMDSSFARYSHLVIENAEVLAKTLMKGNVNIVGNGTETHLVLVDLRSRNITGKQAQEALELARITCNKNGVPHDPQKPSITSGVRLGTPAITTRGMGPDKVEWIGQQIVTVIDLLTEHNGDVTAIADPISDIAKHVTMLCSCYPIYANDPIMMNHSHAPSSE